MFWRTPRLGRLRSSTVEAVGAPSGSTRQDGRRDTAPLRPGGRSTATQLGLEIFIVLGLSLGQSAVYSLLRIIERLTRPQPLNQQTSTLNASATPDRPWLDLTYQLVGIAFALVPVLLALYLLNLTNRPAGAG